MTYRDYNAITISRAIISRLLTKIIRDATTKCWLYPRPYALMYWKGTYYLRHRLMYRLFVEDVIPGKHIDHLCRNPRCINPAHLEQVEPLVNYLRGEGLPAKNARKQFCKRGHPLSGDNLKVSEHNGKLRRGCYQCRYDADVASKRKRGILPKHFNDTHCRLGHELTPENTYIAPNDRLKRKTCRICKRDRKRALKAKRKLEALKSH